MKISYLPVLSSTSANLDNKATVATPEINTPRCNVKKRVTSDTDLVRINYSGRLIKMNHR